MGASVCIILEDLAKKLRLKIEANDETKVVPLEGESKMMQSKTFAHQDHYMWSSLEQIG